MEKRYILQNEEFIILLLSIGIRKIFMFDEFNIDMDMQNIGYNIHQMVRKNILRKTGEGLNIIGEYKKIFLSIKNAENVMVMKNKNEVVCIYIAEKIVVIRKSFFDYNAVKITLIDKENLELFINEDEFFSNEWVSEEIALLIEPSAVDDYINKVINENNLFDPNISYSAYQCSDIIYNAIFLVENHNMKLINKAFVIEGKIAQWLVEKSEDVFKYEPYSKKNIYSLINRWIGGKNYDS